MSHTYHTTGRRYLKRSCQVKKTAEELPIRPAAFYDKNEATLYHGYVRAIDRVKKSVLLENGDVLSYDKLVLCTGARYAK
jgi:3-phenylpropionate/trans-cinnamate dioxygenase ferredoxin reductase subunit